MEGQSSLVKKKGSILASDVCRRCLGALGGKEREKKKKKRLRGPLVEWLVFTPGAVKGGRQQQQRQHGGLGNSPRLLWSLATEQNSGELSQRRNHRDAGG